MLTEKDFEKTIAIFNSQIQKEYRAANGNKEKCISYWFKILYLEVANLEISDWRKIRVGNYWEIHDSLKDIEQIKFILEKVKEYKKYHL